MRIHLRLSIPGRKGVWNTLKTQAGGVSRGEITTLQGCELWLLHRVTWWVVWGTITSWCLPCLPFKSLLFHPWVEALLQHPPGSSPQDCLLPPLPAPRVCLYCIITCILGSWTLSFFFFFFYQSLFQQQCSAWFCFQTHREHAGRPVWHLSLPDKGGSIVIDFLLGHISSFKNILLWSTISTFGSVF